jgi:hypothetical protein
VFEWKKNMLCAMFIFTTSMPRQAKCPQVPARSRQVPAKCPQGPRKSQPSARKSPQVPAKSQPSAHKSPQGPRKSQPSVCKSPQVPAKSPQVPASIPVKTFGTHNPKCSSVNVYQFFLQYSYISVCIYRTLKFYNLKNLQVP